MCFRKWTEKNSRICVKTDINVYKCDNCTENKYKFRNYMKILSKGGNYISKHGDTEFTIDTPVFTCTIHVFLIGV